MIVYILSKSQFDGQVLVNADRHAKLTKKIKESVEYRTLEKQELVTQVVPLGGASEPGGVVGRYQQTLNGSLSAVWTATIARKDAF